MVKNKRIQINFNISLINDDVNELKEFYITDEDIKNFKETISDNLNSNLLFQFNHSDLRTVKLVDEQSKKQVENYKEETFEFLLLSKYFKDISETNDVEEILHYVQYRVKQVIDNILNQQEKFVDADNTI